MNQFTREYEQEWTSLRDRRRMEQQARQRAELEKLQNRLVVAREEGKTTELLRIEAAMNALANQTSQQLREAQWKLNPLAQQIPESPRYDVAPLTEGMPPLPAFEVSLELAEVTNARRQRLKAGYRPDVDPADLGAEQARMALGKAMQAAVDAGAITQQQGLLMMAAGGINADPMSQAETRSLLYGVLAQAVKARFLQLGRAWTIARLIQDAPVGAEEAPGEVPVPDPVPPLEPQVVRDIALRWVPLDGTPLTPAGLEVAGDALQMIAREAPGLVDRLQGLEDLVYEALLVQPCHADHKLHLQSSALCDGQASGLARSLMAGLGLSSRDLPRDVHREPNGERARCCAQDGRIGTWLVYGEYINPDLRMGRRGQVRRGTPRPQLADDIAESESVAAEGP